MDGMSQRTSPGTLPLSRCKLSFWVHVTHMVKNGGRRGGEDASHTTEHVTGQDSGGPRGPLWKACSRKRVPEGFLILLHRTCWVFLKVIEKTVQNALRGTRDALGDMWKAMTLRREARRGGRALSPPSEKSRGTAFTACQRPTGRGGPEGAAGLRRRVRDLMCATVRRSERACLARRAWRRLVAPACAGTAPIHSRLSPVRGTYSRCLDGHLLRICVLKVSSCGICLFLKTRFRDNGVFLQNKLLLSSD